MKLSYESLLKEQPGNKQPQVKTTDSSVTINEIRSQATQLQAAGKTFDQLFTASTQATNISESVNSKQTEPRAPTSEHLIFDVSDPRTVLTVKSNAKKATHITQFLSERTKKKRQSRRREFVLAQSGSEDNFVLKQQEEHPYSGISIDEWSAANCRLMSHLIHSGELPTEDIDYYLAYSTQIYDWAGKYEWEALLDFDYLYRERQAAHCYKWGSLTANMEMQLLCSNVKIFTPQTRNYRNGKSQKNNNVKPNQTPQECRLFKARNGNCPYGDHCKYRHVGLTQSEFESSRSKNVP